MKNLIQTIQELVGAQLSYPTLEMLKEGARLALFAMVSAGLTALGEWVGAMEQTEAWVIAVAFLIRLADKYVHKTDATELKGIAPF